MLSNIHKARRALVSTVMKLRVPKMWGEKIFLDLTNLESLRVPAKLLA